MIKITAGTVTVSAEFNDSDTAKAIGEALPLEGSVQRWGGEIYFSIPVTVGLEGDSRDILEPGELGYWPTGNAFCIFFGATPASVGDEPRAASNVNVFGKITGDFSELWNVADGDSVIIESTKGEK